MSLIVRVEEALEEMEFRYHVVERGDDRVLVGKVGTDSGCLDTMFLATGDEQILELIGNTNHRIPLGAMAECLELTRLINCSLAFGVFNIDGDRDLLLRASTIVGNGYLRRETVEMLIATAACAVWKFVPAYLSVIYGNEPAGDAFREALTN